MGKRENENAQISKEDYEKNESRGGGGDDRLKQGFARASEDVLKKRRIVRTGRRCVKGSVLCVCV